MTDRSLPAVDRPTLPSIASLPARRRVALLLAIVTVVLAGCGGGATDAGPTPTAAGGADGGAASDGGGGDSGQSAAGQNSQNGGGVGSHYDQDGDRVVVREASLTLRVDDFEASFQEVKTIVDESGGYLGDRSQEASGKWDRGRIVIRVPARKFGAVRDALAELGRVESENVEVVDFTSAFRERRDRLAQLREDERRLERALNRTDDPENATALQSKLESIREEIRTVQSKQADLRARARMSTIVLTMHEPVTRKPVANRVTVAGFSNALVGAFYGGMGVLKATVAFVGWLLPVLVAGGILTLVVGVVGGVTVRAGAWALWRIGLLKEPADTADAA